ncbi:MAG: hypothetical protein AAFY38_16935 [Pseudomonadota bacterium]
MSRVWTAETYLADMFGAQAVAKGAVIRRKSRDIDRYVGRERFVTELERRGFRAVENAGQIVIFCNTLPVYPVRRETDAVSRPGIVRLQHHN